MKRFLFLILFLLLLKANLYAQPLTSLPELPAAQNGDLLYVVRPGDAQPDRKMAVQNMRAYMSTGINVTCNGAQRLASIVDGIATCKPAAIDRITASALPSTPSVGDVYVVTDGLNGTSCSGGGTSNNSCQWTGSAWVVIGGGGGGGGGGVNVAANYAWTGVHTFTTDPSVNGQPMCLRNGTNCPSAGSETDPVVAKINGVVKSNGTTISSASATDLPFTPSGTIAATTVQAAIVEAANEAQPLNAANLSQIAAFASTGIATHTGPSAWAERQIVATTSGNILITNPRGVAGDFGIDVGPNVFLSTRSHTQTTGDISFAAALSFTLPRATGAAPTASGAFAYDNTSNRPKYGANGATFTIANTAETQPLSNNLTLFSTLTGGAALVPYWTALTTMGTFQVVPCPASGGNVPHFSVVLGVITMACDTGFASGGLTGATTGKYLAATGTTTFDTASSLLSNNGSNVHIAGGIEVNCTPGTTCIAWDTNDWAAHLPATFKFPYVSGASPFVLFCTGTLTSGHVLKVDAGGGCSDGGVAGTGNVTLAGPNVMNNTTLDEAAGNVFKVTKSVQVELFAPTTDNASGNGQYYFRVPVSLNGTNLIGVQSNVVTAGTTGLASVQVTKCAAVATTPLCSGTTVSMLSTVLSIDSGETSSSTAATAAVINATAGVKAVATGDILRFDVTAIHTTPAKGLFVNLDFKLP